MEGDGIVSGVCVCDWIERNCRRSEDTSVGEKPDVRRRSKPRGAGVGADAMLPCWVRALGVVVGMEVETCASVDSEVSSLGVRVRSPMEQWM